MTNSKTAWLEIRIEPMVKRDAERVFHSCGMSMSGAINLFIRQSINANGLPFLINGSDCAAMGSNSE